MVRTTVLGIYVFTSDAMIGSIIDTSVAQYSVDLCFGWIVGMKKSTSCLAGGIVRPFRNYSIVYPCLGV